MFVFHVVFHTLPILGRVAESVRELEILERSELESEILTLTAQS